MQPSIPFQLSWKTSERRPSVPSNRSRAQNQAMAMVAMGVGTEAAVVAVEAGADVVAAGAEALDAVHRTMSPGPNLLRPGGINNMRYRECQMHRGKKCVLDVAKDRIQTRVRLHQRQEEHPYLHRYRTTPQVLWTFLRHHHRCTILAVSATGRTRPCRDQGVTRCHRDTLRV
jgi:hypothetical protein